jgi:hypothetical protein
VSLDEDGPGEGTVAAFLAAAVLSEFAGRLAGVGFGDVESLVEKGADLTDEVLMGAVGMKKVHVRKLRTLLEKTAASALNGAEGLGTHV